MSPHQLGNFASRYESLHSVIDLIPGGKIDDDLIAETQASLPEATSDFLNAIAVFNEERGRTPTTPVMLNQSIYSPAGDQIMRVDTRMIEDELTNKVLIALYPKDVEKALAAVE